MGMLQALEEAQVPVDAIVGSNAEDVAGRELTIALSTIRVEPVSVVLSAVYMRERRIFFPQLAGRNRCVHVGSVVEGRC